ncbi:MAG: TonB family protein [Acidobacteriia bacterium]|nr:TonB family protein [Terriglobia bacterium]
MALRCFLFSSDEGTSDVIRQVMTRLGIEGESCSHATTAVEKLAQELFQLVVIDWDQQPEAGMLLSAARERKAAERPLILTIVRDDAAVPKALQAGANSILRKPLLVNQVTDTLTTARDLLRSRQESATSMANAAAAAAAAATSSSAPAAGGPVAPASPRANEFVQSTPIPAGGQFETDSEVAHFPEQSAAEQTDPLRDLEPVASAVPERSSPPPPSPSDEPRGLEWHLKARGVMRQPGSVLGTTPAPPAPAKEKPELLGYDQSSSSAGETGSRETGIAKRSQASELEHAAAQEKQEKKEEAQLFSYIAGENRENAERKESRFRIPKGAIVFASVLAACAIVAAPQAPWHGNLAGLTGRGRRALHGWLNPQPVTTVTQAPTSHEDFGRPGDEYKLPVAENIPDATTDPSQISVLPVVDPTAKKPTTIDAGSEQPAGTSTTSAPPDASQPGTVPTPTPQPVQSAPDQPQPAGPSTPTSNPPDSSAHPDVPAPTPAPPVSVQQPAPPAPRPQPTQYTPAAPTKVPSSLKSQMATMVPDASGNKPVEAALPSIEPVDVSELTERALLTDQPRLAYPANAAGKQGTVTLQVLIGRDGTVQDAKFLQGSLAFARAAIDNVRQWKFKPYTMNGRPVSVQTNLTLKFAPAQ